MDYSKNDVERINREQRQRDLNQAVEDRYYDRHGNYLGSIEDERYAHGDNDFRASDEGWEDEQPTQSERSRLADAEQAYRLAKSRRSLGYDSRLDFL